jgi:hypothetical protein
VERQDSISKMPLQLIRLYQVVAVGWGCDEKVRVELEGQPDGRERTPGPNIEIQLISTYFNLFQSISNQKNNSPLL